MTPLKRSTLLVHSDYVPPLGFGGLPVPIYHASTVTYPDVAAMRARDWRRDDGYTYGLHGTPTTFTLEHRIAQMEGGRHTVLAPSGLAAITLVDLALLKCGDDLLLPDNVYGPSRELGGTLLRDFGVSVRYYDPLLGASIAGEIQPNTKLIWIEAPGSVTMEVPDVPAIVAAARARGVLTAIDNTWAGGVLFRPFDYGINVSMHALTKYVSGGSDVLMGAVTTVDPVLHERIKLCHMRLGLGVGADDAYLVLRGLATLELRLRHHEKSAMAVASWLATRPEIARTLHPALPDCPGHQHWKRDFQGSSGLFSVVFRTDIEQARIDAMVDALALFQIGFSWGGSHSLVIPYLMQHARSAVPWTAGGLVRFYVGMEDPSDLIADLEQAFSVFASTP